MSSAQATTACSPESKLLILTPCIFVSTRSKIRSQKDKSRFEIRHYILSAKQFSNSAVRVFCFHLSRLDCIRANLPFPASDRNKAGSAAHQPGVRGAAL